MATQADAGRAFTATLRSDKSMAATLKHQTLGGRGRIDTAQDLQLAKTQPLFFAQPPLQAAPRFEPAHPVIGGIGRTRVRTSCGSTNRTHARSYNPQPIGNIFAAAQPLTTVPSGPAAGGVSAALDGSAAGDAGAFGYAQRPVATSTTYGVSFNAHGPGAAPAPDGIRRAATSRRATLPAILSGSAAAAAGAAGRPEGMERSAAKAEFASALAAAGSGSGVSFSGAPGVSVGPPCAAPPLRHTQKRVVAMPWAYRDHRPPAWAPSAQGQSAGGGSTADAAGAGSDIATPADHQAVVHAAHVLADQLGGLNMRSWFRDAQVPADGISTQLPRQQLLSALPRLGLNLTPKQQDILAEMFYSSTTSTGPAGAAAAPTAAAASSSASSAGAGAGAGQPHLSSQRGGSVDFVHLVSRLRRDEGYVPEVVTYAQRMGHLREAAKVVKAPWPSHSAEDALRLFRTHMDQRPVRGALRDLGFVSRIDYPRFGQLLATLSIHVEPPELSRLCAALDKDGKQFLTFGDIYPEPVSSQRVRGRERKSHERGEFPYSLVVACALLSVFPIHLSSLPASPSFLPPPRRRAKGKAE